LKDLENPFNSFHSILLLFNSSAERKSPKQQLRALEKELPQTAGSFIFIRQLWIEFSYKKVNFLCKSKATGAIPITGIKI